MDNKKLRGVVVNLLNKKAYENILRMKAEHEFSFASNQNIKQVPNQNG